jgi:hypothetical protein
VAARRREGGGGAASGESGCAAERVQVCGRPRRASRRKLGACPEPVGPGGSAGWRASHEATQSARSCGRELHANPRSSAPLPRIDALSESSQARLRGAAGGVDPVAKLEGRCRAAGDEAAQQLLERGSDGWLAHQDSLRLRPAELHQGRQTIVEAVVGPRSLGEPLHSQYLADNPARYRSIESSSAD